jgi:dihydrolipoamide dehydrogenase
VLPEFDPAAGKAVQTGLEKLGVKIAAAQETVEQEFVIVSCGFSPRTADLQLAQVGVRVNANGFVQVNDRQQSSNPAIYAVGNVTGAPALTHVAQKQGLVAAEAIVGRIAQFAHQAIPRLVRTEPALAAVGLSAAEAESSGYRVASATYPLSALSHNREGFIHLVAEQESEVLLGATIVGPGAEALLGVVTLALEMGATLTDLAETVHPAGSAGQALAEAAQAMLG